MARLSISEAARQAGISRQYLHTKYIKEGKLTVHRDELDRPYVDSDELLRVFNGRLPGPKQPLTVADTTLHDATRRKTTLENDPDATGLQVELTVLREQLQATRERETAAREQLRTELDRAQERERWYQQQLERLTEAVKLLEHRPETPAPSPRRGFWGRLLGGGA